MNYRPLGKTGLSLSILGFGASPLGGVFGPIDEVDATNCVRLAFNSGINFFDTAPFYGITKSESFLGKALEGIGRDKYILSTKVGRYSHTDFDFSPGRITAEFENSLRRLRTDHVDLAICHDIEFVDLNRVIHDGIPTLRKLREQGKVRFIGISGLPLKIFRTVLDATELDFVLSYCHYTLANTSLLSLIPYLKEKNVGLINAAPLAMGLLTNHSMPGWHPAQAHFKETAARAAAKLAAKGRDIAELAMQFSIAQPDISSTLVGLASTEFLRKNLEWISKPAEASLIDEARSLLAPIRDQIWPSGLPENN